MIDITSIHIRKIMGIFIGCLVLTVLIIIYIVPHKGIQQNPGGDGPPPIVPGTLYTINSPKGFQISVGTATTAVGTAPILDDGSSSPTNQWKVGVDNSIFPVSAPTFEMYYNTAGMIVMADTTNTAISPPFTISSVAGTKNGYYITRPDGSYVAPTTLDDSKGNTLSITKSYAFTWNFIPVA